MAELVQFYFIADHSLYLTPKIGKDITLTGLLHVLFDRTMLPHAIQRLADLPNLTLYKLGTPVSSECETDKQLVHEILSAQDNQIPVSQTTRVQRLADDQHLSDQYVCLVIELPTGNHETAVHNLRHHHTALFKSLQICLNNIRSWSEDDVRNNLNGGCWFPLSDGQPPPPAIATLEQALVAQRAYVTSAPNGDAHYIKDLDFARSYASQELFAQYFRAVVRPTRQSSVLTNSREFVAFHSLIRCHQPDSERVSKNPSSHFKANQLSSYFFTSPFFSCTTDASKTEFKTELPWKFPIFISTQAEKSHWCKFTPNSDFSVCLKDFEWPVLLCEVISDPQELDRYRMLLEGIAAVRAANVLKKPNITKDLFVVAVYLKANLIAERYIIMQTSSDGKVDIAQQDYNLRESVQAVDFLKSMFNLQDKMVALADELDQSRRDSLSTIAQVARLIVSLTQKRKTTQGTKGNQSRTLDSVREGHHESGQRRGGHFTDAPEIKERLAELGYDKVHHIDEFNNVAMISRESDPPETGFLKFTTQKDEVEISQKLANLISSQTPENHTIRDLKAWELQSGGFLIYSRSGGSHLIHLNLPDVHMWSAAKQLVEGVAFMHMHNIAHLDIKPANVLIHPNGGQLSIIDFGVSRLVMPGQQICGMLGTEDYMAPEVLKEDLLYDPIRADLWSCGRTLQDLVSVCTQSTRQKDFLVGIAEQLMARDPLARPTMADVLKSMVAFDTSAVKRPQPETRFTSATVAVAAGA